MDELLASAAAVGPPLLLLALGAALLVLVGPNDWSLVRPRWEPSWPRGVQEEEPHPWDFSGASPRAVGAAVDADPDGPPAPGPEPVVADLPIRLARVRASPPGPWSPRRT